MENQSVSTSTFTGEVPVRKRIKTFQDALTELSVRKYEGFEHTPKTVYEFKEEYGMLPADVFAYLQIRVITIVLNEGWTPTFTEDEVRWTPFYRVCTTGELVQMNQYQREKCFITHRYSGKSTCEGVEFRLPSSSGNGLEASNGRWIAFKDNGLAEYAGRQFMDIYMQMFGM